MRTFVSHLTLKAVIGILLLTSVPVLCDTTCSATCCPTTSSINPERAKYRATHLPWAVIDCPEQVPELIKNGADVNATDEDGRTALHFAVFNNNYGIAKTLLENGAEVNVKEHSSEGGFCGWGWYPLHLALRNENKDMIRLLVDHGADVNAVRSDGWPPLDTAAYHGQPDMIELLISKGADVKYKDYEALRFAIDLKKIDGALVMIKHGADVNKINNFGRTALHVAASLGDTPAVKELIKYKAKIDIADNKGRTPLYTATYYGFLDIAKLLIANGANVNVHAEGNTSLLQILKEGKHDYMTSPQDQNNKIKRDWYGIKRVLLRHGAK
ncbi:ankyrin repeat domain-containing protein [bacterium]|nr:ankyrin repeat domain-containing protein [bacterium]